MADGTPIKYVASDIDAQRQLVRNGKGDQNLRVIEPRVTMDIAYRIAMLIRQNG